MKKIRVGINGLGRIGRTILRQWLGQVSLATHNAEIVAVNNPGDGKQYTHLLKFDSSHGVLPADLLYENQKLYIQSNAPKFNKELHFFNCPDPAKIPWGQANVDIVIDCTGKFKAQHELAAHLRDSVKKVILCAPGKDLDNTLVMGINHETYIPSKHHVISNASCTTNCLAPVAKVLNDNFKIKSGHMVTIHSYTLDQCLLDASHSDLRRARSAATSIVPTSTGAAKAVGLVMPELKGKLKGYAIRVPTPNVSMVEFTVVLEKRPSADEIAGKMLEASQKSLKGILAVEKLPLVSVDFMGRTESSIFDAELTEILDEGLVSISAWYDNEVGFSCRVLDLAKYIGECGL